MGLKRTMEKMKDYKIEKKLSVSFRATLLMMLISVCVCILGLVYVSTSFTKFYNYYHTITADTLDARMSVQGAVKSVAITLLTDDEASIERFQESAATYAERLSNDLQDLKDLYKGDLSLIEETIDAANQAAEYRQKLNEVVNAGKHEEALEIYMNEYGPTMTTVQNNMEELDNTAIELAQDAFNTSKVVDKLAIIAAIIISIVSFVVTFAISAALIKMLCTPIEEIENAAKEIASGNLHANITYESEDELGNLADSMRMLCNNTNMIIRDLQKITGEMSVGNFRVKSDCRQNYVKDYEPLFNSMLALRDRLNETLVRINESAEMVAEGSEHLAQGAQVLAEGAMDQAGAVEELTATVEDVSSIAENNAVAAQDAYTKVADAEKEADKSQQRLYDLTEAMQVITDTSLKIQNIITTIEDIASQTNLLSLNASIEAARAGEAGRGFAVVADQIGKLAADSAASAVDTKTLIEQCISEVNNGSRIAKGTVEGIESVLEAIKMFEKISDESNKSSRNQADMLNQIREGIEQISVTVQNNSSASEETSATSEELSAQADSLKSEVNAFKLL